MAEIQRETIDEWFESALDLLCIANKDGFFCKVSPSWTSLLGWSEEELLASPIIDFLHPDDCEMTVQANKQLYEDTKLDEFEHRFRKKNGQYVWLSWRASVQKSSPYTIFAIARDVTKTKQQQDSALHDIRLLEMAEQTARVGHWHLDVASGTLKWSNEVFSIYGRKPNKRQIMLDDFIDAFSSSDQKTFWALIQDATQNGQEINTELTLRRDDRTTRRVAIRAVCEKNEHDVVKGLFGIIQDVTAERHHQDRMRSKEELLSMAFRATSDGIWDWDLKTDQVWYSPQWKAQLGYEEDEVVNRFESWANLIFEEDRLIAMEKIDEHFQGQTERFEMVQRFRHKKGHTVFILVRAYALRDEEGHAVRVIGAHTDVTELKKLEQAKSEFTSIVSHELRTPLTAIHGAIGLLHGHYSDEFSDQAKTVLQIANNNSERLKLLINDILDMDKLQSGRMEFDIQPINLGEFLPTVIDNHLSYAKQYDVTLDYDHSGDELAVLGDSNRLMQVMSNLISNAIKFSQNGDTVRVRPQLRDDCVTIAIIDTGRGIAHDQRERIFHKFIQADSSDQRHKGGTGLGLPIAKNMVEKMNGSINVISKVGEGSTFTVTLPKT